MRSRTASTGAEPFLHVYDGWWYGGMNRRMQGNGDTAVRWLGTCGTCVVGCSQPEEIFCGQELSTSCNRLSFCKRLVVALTGTMSSGLCGFTTGFYHGVVAEAGTVVVRKWVGKEFVQQKLQVDYGDGSKEVRCCTQCTHTGHVHSVFAHTQCKLSICHTQCAHTTHTERPTMRTPSTRIA